MGLALVLRLLCASNQQHVCRCLLHFGLLYIANTLWRCALLLLLLQGGALELVAVWADSHGTTVGGQHAVLRR